MTVKTTLSFTDRHHQFLSEKVGQGVFATQSAAVAVALEQMMQDDQERDIVLSALARLCCINQPEAECSFPLNGLIPRVEFAAFRGP